MSNDIKTNANTENNHNNYNRRILETVIVVRVVLPFVLIAMLLESSIVI